MRDGEVFLDVAKESPRWKPAQIKDISDMGPMESRRVWKDVADGIRSGNFDHASQAKGKLENEQRAQRKEEQAKNEPWQLQYFTKHLDDSECASTSVCYQEGIFLTDVRMSHSCRQDAGEEVQRYSA